MEIVPVESAADRERLRSLLVAYHDWMHERAGEVYDPAAELATDLDSLATESRARAWLALVEDGTDTVPAGCVLLYGETDALAEFKRLYVRPEYRGEGVGRALTEHVVRTAREHGHERVGLTTPPWSETAHDLYDSLGFERTGPYPETRLPERHHDGAIFMQLSLTTGE
jgi:GNAT superfamily N-acetyltransferase